MIKGSAVCGRAVGDRGRVTKSESELERKEEIGIRAEVFLFEIGIREREK
jgi:hypothetical protein